MDGIYEGSYCALEIVGEGSISEAIDRVDRALEAVPVSQLLNDKELEKSLYCTIIKDGEIVPFRSLAKLVKWGIQLEIDGPEFSERMDRALPRS